MWNAIPVVGWIVSVVIAISLAVPFWIIWTVCGIGRTYAYWLPDVYLEPGFWACVGIFIVVSIIKTVFVPRLAVATSSSDSKND